MTGLTSANEDTIDEVPVTYKYLGNILCFIDGTVDFIDLMTLVYNFKISEMKHF